MLFQRIYKKFRDLLDVYGTPSNGQIPQWVSANSRFEYIAATSSNTNDTIVMRDDSGAINASLITLYEDDPTIVLSGPDGIQLNGHQIWGKDGNGTGSAGSINMEGGSIAAGAASFTGPTTLSGGATATGIFVASGLLTSSGGFVLSGNSTSSAVITSSGAMTQSGAFTASGNTKLSGNTTATGAFTASGNTILSGNSTISGACNATGVLTISNTSSTWSGSPIAVAYGGSGFASYTLGDLVYASTTTGLAKLAGNTTTSRKFLTQTGTGTVSAPPAWFDLLATANTFSKPQTITPDTAAVLNMFSPTPNSTNRNDYSGHLGGRWTPAVDLTVRRIGRYYTGSTGDHYVAIWRTSDHALLASGTISHTATADGNGYKWYDLPSALVLTAGVTVDIAGDETASGDAWRDLWDAHLSYRTAYLTLVGSCNGATSSYPSAFSGGNLIYDTVAIGFDDPSGGVVGLTVGGTGKFTGGVMASSIASGALPTITLTSGTATQILITRDVALTVPVTLNPSGAATATVKVEVSPDNTTFSTLVTKTAPALASLAGFIDEVALIVPAGWYVKLTATNATLGTGTYF